jgi:hypothetical protein
MKIINKLVTYFEKRIQVIVSSFNTVLSVQP